MGLTWPLERQGRAAASAVSPRREQRPSQRHPDPAPYRPPPISPIFPSSHVELPPNEDPGFNTDVVFLSGVRTGFGTFGGTLKDLSAIELGAVAAKHALERAGVPPAEV